MGDYEHSTTLERLLGLLRQGHDSARAGLLAHAQDRVRRLARHMFRRQPDLRGPDDTDDVLQKALIRLDHALGEVQPESVAAFFGLASRHIRFVLLDLVRELRRRHIVQFRGDLPPSTHRPVPEPEDPEGEPSTLAAWAEFHEQVEQLPDEARRVFDLLWYQGLTQPEAAQVMGVSLATLQRRWAAARVLLQRILRAEPEGEGA